MDLDTQKTKDLQRLLDGLYTDLLMLEDGSWVPNVGDSSISSSIDAVIEIAELLNLLLEDTREEVYDNPGNHSEDHDSW